jgi:dihydrofolate reductase
MKLVAVVAMTGARIIGKDGSLPWHLPADLAFFKRTTRGHAIVMGRKTFESIGRPLPQRRNIVLTRDPHWRADGVEVVHSLTELQQLGFGADETVFLIGGAQLYQALLAGLDEILVSHVHAAYPGDTVFPAFEHLFGDGEVIEAHADFEVRRYLRRHD